MPPTEKAEAPTALQPAEPKPDIPQSSIDNKIVTTAQVHTPSEQADEAKAKQIVEVSQETAPVPVENVEKTAEQSDKVGIEKKETELLQPEKIESTTGNEANQTTASVAENGKEAVDKNVAETPAKKETVEEKSAEAVAKDESQKAEDQSVSLAPADTSSAKPSSNEQQSKDTATSESGKASVGSDANAVVAAETENNATAPEQTQPTADQVADESSKSFQVLPGNEPGDTVSQEQKNTGNLEPPTDTEPVRKPSFTILKSDESIDDILADNEENQSSHVSTTSALISPINRPKSFKILNALHPDGDDIVLQQSSDHERSGNDDDYLNESNLINQRTGKYSDSELIKYDEHLNGRKKKYKKRAKSVKTVTVVGDSLQNKDQDSGFEPSPRAIRPSKFVPSTRLIYTAALPERPRATDILDGRSCSSRLEKRKPGDKYAVNMSQVSQSLQRNIRRYDAIDYR